MGYLEAGNLLTKAALFIPWMLISTLRPYLSFPSLLTRRISDKATAADMQMRRENGGVQGSWDCPTTGRARRGCIVTHGWDTSSGSEEGGGGAGQEDIGWPDLQHVLLTSIFWPVNRRAPLGVYNPPPPLHPSSAPAPHHFIALPGCAGWCLRSTMMCPCGDPHCCIPICYWIPPSL